MHVEDNEIQYTYPAYIRLAVRWGYLGLIFELAAALAILWQTNIPRHFRHIIVPVYAVVLLVQFVWLQYVVSRFPLEVRVTGDWITCVFARDQLGFPKSGVVAVSEISSPVWGWVQWRRVTANTMAGRRTFWIAPSITGHDKLINSLPSTSPRPTDHGTVTFAQSFLLVWRRRLAYALAFAICPIMIAVILFTGDFPVWGWPIALIIPCVMLWDVYRQALYAPVRVDFHDCHVLFTMPFGRHMVVEPGDLLSISAESAVGFKLKVRGVRAEIFMTRGFDDWSALKSRLQHCISHRENHGD